jgi:hypothetical protein
MRVYVKHVSMIQNLVNTHISWSILKELIYKKLKNITTN